MSIATISIAPTPLKEYKNTIIWKTPPVKWNQDDTQYHLQWIIESPSKWCWKTKEQIKTTLYFLFCCQIDEINA